MDLAQSCDVGISPLEPPKDEYSGSTDGEAQKQPGVRGARAEGLSGADGAPEDGRGEEGVDARAGHAVGRVGRAYVLHAHLEVRDSRTDKGSDQRGDDLGTECDSGRNLKGKEQLVLARRLLE